MAASNSREAWPISRVMRTQPHAIPCLFLLACTPETELGQIQAGATPSETTSGSLSSPEPDPLAGRLVEPPSGATGIPTNLASLVVSFTEPVAAVGSSPPFLLHSAEGIETALALGSSVPCAHACYRIVPAGGLAPSSQHTLEVVPGMLMFLDGKPTPGGEAGAFMTAAGADGFAPRVVAFEAQVTAGCISVHVAADEPVQAEVVVSGVNQTFVIPAGNFATTSDIAERLPAAATGGSAQVAVRIVDRAGNQAESAATPIELPPPLPLVFITEVLANPAGSESTQEFVEIYNAGSDAVALAGLVIEDKSSRDALPEATLAPGAFALIVAEKYDPAEGSDVPPREGALLVRVPGRIGSDGFSNSGEVVRLVTAAGDVVSQYGGFVDVSATAWSGKSVKRSSPEACDAASAWTTSPTPATPGW
jgi:hypothetical protein